MKLNFCVFNISQDLQGKIEFTYRKKANPFDLRTKKDLSFKPYFYIPYKESDKIDREAYPQIAGIKKAESKTLKGDKLVRIYTQKSIDVRDVRSAFAKTYEADIIYTRRWSIDRFWDKEWAEISPRVHILDIEVLHAEGEFPNFKDPKFPIIALSVYDSYLEKTITIAFKEGYSYESKKKGVYVFSTEREMLQFYLAWYRENIPDVITGWNVIRFDMNYLYYRLTRLFERDFVNKVMSPFGWVGRSELVGRFGAKEEVISIKGVFMVDYLTLYRKYSPQMRENYRLDYISEIEFSDRKDLEKTIKIKRETAGKVRELYFEDFPKLLKYNRDDVTLVRELDEKFKFIHLIDYVRRFSRTLFDDYDFISAVVDGYMLCEAKHRGVALPTAMKDQHGDFPGAFVLEPNTSGLKKWIVSYDLNALYPNIIKTINISPETKIGTWSEDWHAKSDGIPYAKAGNDIVFWTEKEGFIPAAISNLVDLRNHNKAKSLELKRQNKPYESYSKLEKALKVIANGTYGYLSFRKSRFFDLEMAGAVTMTGQKLIKKIIEDINGYMRKSYRLEEDIVLASDSVGSKSLIKTDLGEMTIEDLFEFGEKSGHGDKEQSVVKEKVFTEENGKAVFRKPKRIIRHKVRKKMFRVWSGDKYVDVSEDHSVMVKRGDEVVEMKPQDIRLGDKIIKVMEENL